jgi:hypothetical protein
MTDFTKKIGPLSLRAWGLVANFGANALALYGLTNILKDNGGWTSLIIGVGLTVFLILFLAQPNRD